jgi:hypothetical protein
MVLSPVCQGHLMMILLVFRRIATECIQLSLDCPKNPTRWRLQIFFMHLLLSFVHHHLSKLVTFSLNLLKKFLTTLERLPVTPSCMLPIERFNRNHRNQCRYKPHITVSFI